MGAAFHSHIGYRFRRRRTPLSIADRANQRADTHLAAAVLGVVSLAVLGVAGGAGMYWGAPHQGGPTPMLIPVTAVATTTTPGGPISADQQNTVSAQVVPAAVTNAQLSPAEQKLVGLLPAGYGPSSCQSVTPPVAGATGTVDCWNNSLPGGPTGARYSLFSDQQTLENVFQTKTLNEMTAQPCPGGGASPGQWDYKNNPNQTAGSIVCGVVTATGSPGVSWTDDTLLIEGAAQGPDLAALYNWWTNPQPSGPSGPSMNREAPLSP